VGPYLASDDLIPLDVGPSFALRLQPQPSGCRSFFLAALRSLPACSLAEFVSRLSAALMNVHDLPAAIKPRSGSFSSNVQRILGMTRSFSSLQPELDQAAYDIRCASQKILAWFSATSPAKFPSRE
jgi:hypothetical protein